MTTRAAIYSRKSKYTGKGESIENQVQLCKEYAEKYFGISDALVYEDEGFSGGTTGRPEFQQMLKDARARKFDLLICYRLDRVSRNVADFSALIDELKRYDISFVSIREQFDTTTPMGRAMMYIASVFAQLERETIAERIRDNMLQLAKTGRWLGGTTPTGFASAPVTYTDSKGKERTLVKLVPVDNELETVRIIYDKFLELRSLTKLETYCIQNDITSKNNVAYSRFALRGILTNPVYATADGELYQWFLDNDYEVYASEADFDGIHGVMAYNKTVQRKNITRFRGISEWIIAVGAHKGVLTGSRWIAAQRLILQNKSLSYRKVRNLDALLSGILRCASCGSYMRPRTGRRNKDGTAMFYYMCELKEKSKKVKCQMTNANGNKLDRLVVEELKKLSSSSSALHDRLAGDKISIETTRTGLQAEIEMLEGNIRDNEQSIANLVSSLSQGENMSAARYIIDRINAQALQAERMKERLVELKEKEDANQAQVGSLDVMANMLTSFTKLIDTLDVPQKRDLIRSVVESMVWDGSIVNIVMFGAGSKKELPPTEPL